MHFPEKLSSKSFRIRFTFNTQMLNKMEQNEFTLIDKKFIHFRLIFFFLQFLFSFSSKKGYQHQHPDILKSFSFLFSKSDFRKLKRKKRWKSKLTKLEKNEYNSRKYKNISVKFIFEDSTLDALLSFAQKCLP